MKVLAVLFLLLDGSASEPPWSELSLSIEREAGVSSDRVTICRVRVVNHGSHTWPGRTLHFEARAIDGGVVVERARGRFGLSLSPHGTLETLIGFSVPEARFEVSPAPSSPDSGGSRKRAGGKRPRRSSKPRAR
jgi:hypothetical protein